MNNSMKQKCRLMENNNADHVLATAIRHLMTSNADSTTTIESINVRSRWKYRHR